MKPKRELTRFTTSEELLSDDELAVGHGQYMTKRWAAQLLFDAYFSNVGPDDIVADLTAGTGSWLSAVPTDVEAFGVEIDARLAARASADTGRRIIVGDFRTVAIEPEPSVLNRELPRLERI